VKFVGREISQVVRCLPEKKSKFRLALSLSLLRGSRPKSTRTTPDNVLRLLQISPKSAHVWRSYTRKREHHQNGPQWFQYSVEA